VSLPVGSPLAACGFLRRASVLRLGSGCTNMATAVCFSNTSALACFLLLSLSLFTSRPAKTTWPTLLPEAHRDFRCLFHLFISSPRYPRTTISPRSVRRSSTRRRQPEKTLVICSLVGAVHVISPCSLMTLVTQQPPNPPTLKSRVPTSSLRCPLASALRLRVVLPSVLASIAAAAARTSRTCLRRWKRALRRCPPHAVRVHPR
jgi:hypothetical protein